MQKNSSDKNAFFGEFETTEPATTLCHFTVKADSNGYFCHGPPNFEETGTVSDDWKVLDMDGLCRSTLTVHCM